MANDIGFRLVIQKPTGRKDKYYMGIIDGDISQSYPFKVATANLKINTSAGPNTKYYLAPVAIDDIVRVQINYKLTSTEPDVWLDMFEGRIKRVGNGISASAKTVTIQCVGHGNPLSYTYFSSDQTFTSQTTGYIVNAMLSSLARLTDAIPSRIDQTGSTTLTEYTVKANAKTFAAIIADLETYELDGYIFRTKTVYDEDGNLDEVNSVWEQAGEVIDTVQVNEGSRSFISADFTEEDRMVNKVVVIGDGVSATAQDTTLQATYDVRQETYVDTSITTASACQIAANAILARWKLPVVTGTVVLRGQPYVRAGDKVHCRISSISAAGDDIDDDYVVRKVVQKIGKKFETTLTLGEQDVSPSELIYIILNRNQRNNLNSI